jgi:hypothetical protein
MAFFIVEGDAITGAKLEIFSQVVNNLRRFERDDITLAANLLGGAGAGRGFRKLSGSNVPLPHRFC